MMAVSPKVMWALSVGDDDDFPTETPTEEPPIEEPIIEEPPTEDPCSGGHSTVDIYTDATCTSAGSISSSCAVCGTTIYSEETPALGHDYYEFDAQEPTCVTPGYRKYECSRCHETMTEEFEATGHTWKLTETLVEATCTSEGSGMYTCANCGEEQEDVIPAPHNWVDGICTICGAKKTSLNLTYLSGTSGFNNEGSQNLIDGNDGTKWCYNWYSNTKAYVIFKTDEPASIVDYYMVHGGDTNTNPGRAWSAWTIYGANFDSDSEAVSGSDKWKKVHSKTGFSYGSDYSFSNLVCERYQYYKVVIDNIVSGDLQQMAEIHFTFLTCNHSLEYHEPVADDCVNGTDGCEEYWQCTKCGNLYSDADGKANLTAIPVVKAFHRFEDGECRVCHTPIPTITGGTYTGITIKRSVNYGDTRYPQTLYKYVAPASGQLTVMVDGCYSVSGSLLGSDMYTPLAGKTDVGGTGSIKLTPVVQKGETYYLALNLTYASTNSCDGCTLTIEDPCEHKLAHHEAAAADCKTDTDGHKEYYYCSECKKYFADAEATQLLEDGLPVIKPRHDYGSDGKCTVCGAEYQSPKGTEYDLANYTSAPIYVYKDRFECGSNTQPYTGNLIFTGTTNKMIYLNEMPAAGSFVLRNANISVSSEASAVQVVGSNAEIVVEGDVDIYGGSSGALFAGNASPSLTISGPGNLTLRSSSSTPTIIGTFGSVDIRILGDFKQEGAAFTNSSNYDINIDAKSITANGTSSTLSFFMIASRATLHAQGDILLESVSTNLSYSLSGDKIWLFKSIESDKGTVLMRMGKGTWTESVGVKDSYQGIPAVSSGNTSLEAFTWKVVNDANHTMTYYGANPSSMGGISTVSDPNYRLYLSLVKDDEGNTVFDMAKMYNAPLNLYNDHINNGMYGRIGYDGHPVFTGNGGSPKALVYNEELTADHTPILRNLNLSPAQPCLGGNSVKAIIDGNVILDASGAPAISAQSCTITGKGSLTLKGGGNNYSCPDMNIDITGDLVSTIGLGAPLTSQNIDSSKLHANSIKFVCNAGGSSEQAIIMPVPDTTPAASSPSISYSVKLENKDRGFTLWAVDYGELMSGGVATSLDGVITVVDESKYDVVTAPLTLSDNSKLDFSAYTSTTDCFYVPSVSYERSMGTSKWGTIVIPFELRSNEDVQFYAVTDVDMTEGVLVATPVDVVYPGHPCLFKRLGSGNLCLSSSEKTMASLDFYGEFLNEDWYMYSTYADETLDATGGKNYYYINSDKFWHATGTVNVKPYRAYFTGPAPVSSAKALTIVTSDGEETGIEAMMDDEGHIHSAAAEGIYDLQGRKRTSLQKGLNIVGGKKVVVK